MSQDAATQQLIATLRDLDRSKDPTWTAGLPSRKQEEASYHDYSHSFEEISDRESGRANKKYYLTAQKSVDYRLAWIREHARGKIFLDYACGSGAQVIEAARAGAELAVGIDISPGSVQVAQEQARSAGVSDNTAFVCADCEDTRFPAGAFDAVLCSGVLHHMDLSYAFPELRRILKRGGTILAVEGLETNPLIRLYRRRTPELRTGWEAEHIIGTRDLVLASYFFQLRNIRYWHFFSIMTTPFRRTPLFPFLLNVANRVDKWFLSLPVAKKLAWQITFELHKAGDA